MSQPPLLHSDIPAERCQFSSDLDLQTLEEKRNDRRTGKSKKEISPSISYVSSVTDPRIILDEGIMTFSFKETVL